MFSLIITTVAIALVVVLALATIYFGGSAFKQGQTAARAATMVNQGQQISAAMDLYLTSFGVWPDSLDKLVSTGYLTAIPVPVALAPSEFQVIPAAYAIDVATGPWTMPASGVPTVVVQAGVSLATCQEVNQRVRGDNGVLLQAYSTYSTQCYGASSGSLKMVVTRDGSNLIASLPPADVAPASSPPPLATDATSPAWQTAPVAKALAAPPPVVATSPAPNRIQATFTQSSDLTRVSVSIVVIQGPMTLGSWSLSVVNGGSNFGFLGSNYASDAYSGGSGPINASSVVLAYNVSGLRDLATATGFDWLQYADATNYGGTGPTLLLHGNGTRSVTACFTYENAVLAASPRYTVKGVNGPCL